MVFPFIFLTYISDPKTCIRYSKTYHLTDNKNIIRSSKSLKELTKRINHDLKEISQYLNIKETELITFSRKSKCISHSAKFILGGKRLISSNAIKYLGVFLSEHLKLKKQIACVSVKRNQVINILGKTLLRYY